MALFENLRSLFSPNVAYVYGGDYGVRVADMDAAQLYRTQPSLRAADLAGFKVPTLVVAGKNDMIRDSHTRAIHRAIAGSRLAILPGDHFVAHGNPEAFNAAVLEFLSE